MRISSPALMNSSSFRAALFDMDGVVTDTSGLHYKSWDVIFRESSLVQKQGLKFSFNDYLTFLDGKPREIGIASLLSSKGILFHDCSRDPHCVRDDCINTLANRKQEAFMKLVETHGVRLFDDAIQILRILRDSGIKLGLVTSSRNSSYTINNANLGIEFDVVVDGSMVHRGEVKGKPAPDMFLLAARELDVPPECSVVIEDSVSGVQAAKSGSFGLIIGVDRSGQAQSLYDAGSHIVVSDLVSSGVFKSTGVL